MITRYAVLNWDSISIISFLRRAYAARGSVMTERVETVKRSSTHARMIAYRRKLRVAWPSQLVCWGSLRMATASVLVPILTHVVWDLVVLLVYPLPS